MVAVTIEEAQKRLVELLADVAGGEEVVIYRGNVPLGRLLPPSAQATTKSRRQFGHLAGQIQIADDFDAPMEEFAEYS